MRGQTRAKVNEAYRTFLAMLSELQGFPSQLHTVGVVGDLVLFNRDVQKLKRWNRQPD